MLEFEFSRQKWEFELSAKKWDFDFEFSRQKVWLWFWILPPKWNFDSRHKTEFQFSRQKSTI